MEGILQYFSCEEGGIANNCSRSDFEFEEHNNPVLVTLSYVLLGLFPITNLIYAVNIQDLRPYCKRLREILKSFADYISSSATRLFLFVFTLVTTISLVLAIAITLVVELV